MGNAKQVLRSIKHALERAYVASYSISHPIEKQVFFESFSGKQYSDNPRAISEKLHELFPEYTIYWKLNNTDNPYGIIPDYVKRVPAEKNGAFPFEYLKVLATSCCFVTNEALDAGMPKRKGQFFICTWHGDRGFKKTAYDLPDFSGSLGEGKLADLCLAGSDFAYREYRTAFRYKGEILKIGTPRDDCLIKNSLEQKKIIKERLGLDDKTKYILYAPTFVDFKNKEKQDVETFSAIRTIETLESKTGEQWRVLSRAHSAASAGLMFSNDDNEIVLDVSDYPDMADILLISDALITDYSSSAGDAALLGIPVLLFIPQKTERPLYFELDESPYYVANTQDELEEIIMKLDLAKVQINDKEILDFYVTHECGKASEIVANRIHEEYKNRRKRHRN